MGKQWIQHKMKINPSKKVTMKTNNQLSKSACCLFIYLGIAIASLTAQTSLQNKSGAAEKNIKIESIVTDFGTQWLGQKEIAYGKVMLTWHVNADANIVNFEIECSFDFVNYKSVGETNEEFASNEKVKTYKFEDSSPALIGQNIAQYRIKQTDVTGKVTYSEAKVTGLKS